MSETATRFTRNFRELRRSKRMTQAEVASLLGISRPTVGFYETGKRFPDAKVIVTICDKFNVSADWLLGTTKLGEIWLDVEYCLPPVEETVIVSIKDDSGDTPWCYTHIGWYSGIGNKWVVDNEFNTMVRFWLPMPKPKR